MIFRLAKRLIYYDHAIFIELSYNIEMKQRLDPFLSIYLTDLLHGLMVESFYLYFFNMGRIHFVSLGCSDWSINRRETFFFYLLRLFISMRRRYLWVLLRNWNCFYNLYSFVSWLLFSKISFFNRLFFSFLLSLNLFVYHVNRFPSKSYLIWDFVCLIFAYIPIKLEEFIGFRWNWSLKYFSKPSQVLQRKIGLLNRV